MQAEENKVVFIDYTLTNDKTETLDSSIGDEPLSFIFGSGFIIPGLEAAIAGKKIGDKFSVRVSPEQGYGKRFDELTQVVPRTMFQDVDNIELGMEFHAENEAGEMHTITVIGIDGDQLTIDGNHALAGEVLNFDVEIVNIRDATLEEINHGHVHGANGCETQ